MMRPDGKLGDANMNLLDMEDDSEEELEFEHFALKPLTTTQPKGKRFKKKQKQPSSFQSVYGQNSSSGDCCCNAKRLCLILIVFLIVAAMSALGMMTYITMNELRTIKERLSKVEKGNLGTPEELQSFHSKLQDLSNAVNGEQGLEKLNNDMLKLYKQISVLNDTAKKLSASMATAPQLQKVPEQVQQITANTATMGSTLNILTDKVNSLTSDKTDLASNQKRLFDRVDNIEKRLSSSPTPVPITGKTVANNVLDNERITGLRSEVEHMNKTFNDQFAAIYSTQQAHQEKVSRTVNLTAQLDHRLNALELKNTLGYVAVATNTSVDTQDIVNDVLKALTDKNITTVGSNFDSKELLANVTQLVKVLNVKIAHLTEMIPMNLTNSTTGSVNIKDVENLVHTALAKSRELDKYEEQIYNVSIQALNESLTSLGNTVSRHQLLLTNLTTKQEELILRVERIISQNKTVDSKNDNDVITPATVTQKPKKRLVIPDISNEEMLESSFALWDVNNVGHVSYSQMWNDLGNKMPSSLEMRDYDLNGDGEYSLEELRTAFGFSPKTTPSPAPQAGTTVSPGNSTGQSPAPQDSTTVSTGKSTVDALTEPSILHIPQVTTVEDLETHFSRWDIDHDGEVDPQDIKDFLGLDAPSADQLKPFDKNEDGLYNLAEMKTALGFKDTNSNSADRYNYPLRKARGNQNPSLIKDLRKRLSSGRRR